VLRRPILADRGPVRGIPAGGQGKLVSPLEKSAPASTRQRLCANFLRISFECKNQTKGATPARGGSPFDCQRPVAAQDTKQAVMDGPAKLLKENRTVQNRPSPAEMAITKFRVRYFQPLSHLYVSIYLSGTSARHCASASPSSLRAILVPGTSETIL